MMIVSIWGTRSLLLLMVVGGSNEANCLDRMMVFDVALVLVLLAMIVKIHHSLHILCCYNYNYSPCEQRRRLSCHYSWPCIGIAVTSFGVCVYVSAK